MTIVTTHLSSVSLNAGRLVLVNGASITDESLSALSLVSMGLGVWLGGTVWSGSYGVRSYADAQGSALTTVEVGASGTVHGELAGMFLEGQNLALRNLGTVTGASAIELSGDGADVAVSLRNDGQIIGEQSAILQALSLTGHCDLTLVNRGLIAGDENAVASFDDDASLRIINRGTMLGNILTGGGQDVVNNSGHIDGDIRLGDGADVVRLVRSQDAQLLVMLEGGDDTAYLGGVGAETVIGGEGSDLVSYEQAIRGVTVNLVNSSLNRGAAAGDVLSQVENLRGSDLGDRLVGDAQDNQLEGGAGNDVLNGGAGRDSLEGGAGQDRLIGGLGNDMFFFSASATARDVVTDFGAVAGNRDSIGFLSSGTDANLDSGALDEGHFILRADNQAQDSDDYFIFRSTDRTLWYDADGSGTLRSAVMLADFGATVMLSAADFTIF